MFCIESQLAVSWGLTAGSKLLPLLVWDKRSEKRLGCNSELDFMILQNKGRNNE
jgi:hypothetical protein